MIFTSHHANANNIKYVSGCDFFHHYQQDMVSEVVFDAFIMVAVAPTSDIGSDAPKSKRAAPCRPLAPGTEGY